MIVAEPKEQGRQTRYVIAILDALRQRSHATNLEILGDLRQAYPMVSATTVHRVTARLADRKIIAHAPKSADGSERYDITPQPHHHFVCSSCGRVCDVPETDEAGALISALKRLSGECAIAGTLTLYGTCRNCVKEVHG